MNPYKSAGKYWLNETKVHQNIITCSIIIPNECTVVLHLHMYLMMPLSVISNMQTVIRLYGYKYFANLSVIDSIIPTPRYEFA